MWWASDISRADRADIGSSDDLLSGFRLAPGRVGFRFVPAIMRKRKTMDISRSLEDTGIGSLRGVHRIRRKSGQNDRRSVHLDLARLQGQDATATQLGQFFAQAEHLSQQ